MRSYVPEYEVRTPATLKEALSLFDREPGVWRALAGGTDLMVLLESGKLQHRKWLNIAALSELKGISQEGQAVRIAALTTFSEIARHPLIEEHFPLLAEAARSVGAVAVQNRATIGGNVANASPAADSPPALLAYDAEVELVSPSGRRRLPYHQFHQGYKKLASADNELISAFYLPISGARRHQYFRKVGTRKAQAISKVCFAGVVERQGALIVRARIALGSVAPVPLRCHAAERLLEGKPLDQDRVSEVVAAVVRAVAPIDDIRSTAEYRREVAGNLVREFLGNVLREP